MDEVKVCPGDGSAYIQGRQCKGSFRSQVVQCFSVHTQICRQEKGKVLYCRLIRDLNVSSRPYGDVSQYGPFLL